MFIKSVIFQFFEKISKKVDQKCNILSGNPVLFSKNTEQQILNHLVLPMRHPVPFDLTWPC